MRYPIAQACLLSALLLSPTAAQCPKICRNSCEVAQTRQTFSCQPAYTVISKPVPDCRTNTCVSSCPILQGSTVTYSYPAASGCKIVHSYPPVSGASSSITHSSPQFWPSAAYPSAYPSVAETAFPPNVAIIQPSSCNCTGYAGTSPALPQASSQTASAIECKRNPFSLAGHAREVKSEDFCQREFLSCCESGAKDCMLNYAKCTEITGEPLRHNICPAEVPMIVD